jgi:predicted ATPase/DNA-binding CsgD family transcriptional regulator
MASEGWLPHNEEGLNKRAVEILRLLAEGMTNREIAERLVLAISTVKWYNRQIYSILDVSSRTQAIARAHELRLLDEDDNTLPAFGRMHHSPKHNLPVEATRFIGRKHEMGAIKLLLGTARVLTLVGPPGTGKTRLALQLARDVVDDYREGVFFVSLASINDPALVTNAIANTVGVNEAHDQPLIETLKRFLCQSHMLLILDNFEHLLPAAAQVADLLAAVPYLKVLTTSREPLHLYGEQEYAVPPLELPDPASLDLQALADCESTALFVQQARAVRPDFELTAENAVDVARICVRLEGLPLAIELAAARIKLLTPHMLLERLSNMLSTLTGGAQNLPIRQQTLLNTIDWSYNLLNDDEQRLLTHLAVFQGGGSLEAFEAVCGHDLSIELFDGLTALVAKSLIRLSESVRGEPRFTMLETIHEYAYKKLDQSSESSVLFDKHAEWFVGLAEGAEAELRGQNQSFWLDMLTVEEANFRAVLNRCHNNLIKPEFGLRLAGSLQHFWKLKGSLQEGDRWLNEMLAHAQEADPRLRAKALCGAGDFAYHRGNFDRVAFFCNQALEISRQVGDKEIAAQAIHFLAHVAQHAGNYVEGEALLSESLALSHEIGDLPRAAQALNCLGDACRFQGDYEKGRALMEEALTIYRELQHPRGISIALNNLGMMLQRLGEHDQATTYLHEALNLALQINNESTVSHSIIGLAGLSIARGHPDQAAILVGIAEAIHRRTGTSLAPTDRIDQAAYLSAISEQLDTTTFNELKENGQAMSFEEAISYIKANIVDFD